MRVRPRLLCIALLFTLLPATIHATGGGTSSNSKVISCLTAMLGELTNETRFGHVTYPDAPTAEFRPIRHINFHGMEHVNGQSTNVGNLAFVTYQENGRAPQRIVGRVVKESQAGMDVMDERTGQIFSCNVNFGKILSVQIRPSAASWTRVWGDASELAKIVSSTREPYALVSLSVGKSQRTIYGKIIKHEVEPGYTVFAVRDSRGELHVFDPEYVDFSAMITSGNAESKAYFPAPAKASANPIFVLDSNRSERLRWTKDLQASQNVYDNPEYYRFLGQDVPSTKKLIQRWFPRQAGPMIKSVETELGAQYVTLLADPGIANRSTAFVTFGKKYLAQHREAPPWQLRKAFSDHLGNRKIYRGMVLTEAEASNMQRNGVLAPGMLNREEATTSIFETLDPNHRYNSTRHARNPGAEITARLTDFYDANKNMFISVSDYEPIAASVGYHDSGKVGDPTRRLYVFEINIPEISLIKREGLFAQENSHESNVIMKIGNNFRVNETHDRGVEMFVPYKIDPRNIISVKRHDTPPPKWERELTK